MEKPQYAGTKRTENTPASIDRLVALPVAGDAFLLVRDGDSVLIDGGTSGELLYNELKKELPGPLHIRRIVCTHNDNDHAGGLAEMLEDKSRYSVHIEEVWLPGSWADAAAKVAEGQFKVLARELLLDVKEMMMEGKRVSLTRTPPKNATDPSSRGTELRFYRTIRTEKLEEPKLAERKGRRKSTSARIKATKQTLKKRIAVAKQIAIVEKGGAGFINRHGRTNNHAISTCKKAADLYCQLVSALERIYRIVVAALSRNAKIRWFDAQAYYRSSPRKAKGGDKSNLIPLNSIELKFPPSAVDLTYTLFLTQVNLHSLTFWAPETHNHPGCVFSADGLLNGDALKLPPARPVAITAPHHGSKSNEAAYSEIARMIGVTSSWPTDSIILRSKVDPMGKTIFQRI